MSTQPQAVAAAQLPEITLPKESFGPALRNIEPPPVGEHFEVIEKADGSRHERELYKVHSVEHSYKHYHIIIEILSRRYGGSGGNTPAIPATLADHEGSAIQIESMLFSNKQQAELNSEQTKLLLPLSHALTNISLVTNRQDDSLKKLIRMASRGVSTANINGREFAIENVYLLDAADPNLDNAQLVEVRYHDLVQTLAESHTLIEKITQANPLDTNIQQQDAVSEDLQQLLSEQDLIIDLSTEIKNIATEQLETESNTEPLFQRQGEDIISDNLNSKDQDTKLTNPLEIKTELTHLEHFSMPLWDASFLNTYDDIKHGGIDDETPLDRHSQESILITEDANIVLNEAYRISQDDTKTAVADKEEFELPLLLPGLNLRHAQEFPRPEIQNHKQKDSNSLIASEPAPKATLIAARHTQIEISITTPEIIDHEGNIKIDSLAASAPQHDLSGISNTVEFVYKLEDFNLPAGRTLNFDDQDNFNKTAHTLPFKSHLKEKEEDYLIAA